MTANKGQLFIGLAVALGVAAAVVGYYTLTSMAASADSGLKASMRPVVVTAGDLTYGVKLEHSMLRVVQVPREAAPEGAFADPDSVVGQVTKVFMSAREPVTAIKLSSRGGGLSVLVRPSMRAASIQVNQVSGVSGFVLPGDRVDVLATVDHGGDGATTRTILQNIEVLAAGQKTEQQDNKPITVQSVTLLIDPAAAEALALAQHQGELHLVLRNPDDQEQVPVASLSTGQMLNLGAPRSSGGGARRAAPAAEPADKKIRIIRSADVTEQPALRDSIQ